MTSVVRLLTNKNSPLRSGEYRDISFVVFFKTMIIVCLQNNPKAKGPIVTGADNKIVLDATDTLKVLVISLDALTQEYTSIG